MNEGSRPTLESFKKSFKKALEKSEIMTNNHGLKNLENKKQLEKIAIETLETNTKKEIERRSTNE